MQVVLDVSDRSTITTAAEIDLPRDQDSVQSLSSLATPEGLITFAGINSSQESQNAGKNDHLRSFDIKYPPRKKQKTDQVEVKGQISPLGKNSLFTPTPSAKSETYQRLLRLSPALKRANGGKRIGAIATGLAKRSELVVFNATTSAPQPEDVITRIVPDGGVEVGDLDLATPGVNEFSLTFCTDYDVYEQTYQYDFSTKQVQKMPKGPRRIHQMPAPDAGSTAPRSRFRGVRFLDPQNVVALLNKPGRKGAELRVYHLYPTGPAATVLQMSLPSRIKQAVSLDVCALDADKKGNRQIVVAVAGQDISIEVYTINYNRSTDTFSRFKSYQSFKNVHPQQMTKLCLSPFHSPARASNPDEEPKDEKTAESSTPIHPGPQYIRLASVSYGNTVVVDTFPLSPLNTTDKDSRYVLSSPSDERFQRLMYTYFAFAIPLLLAYLVHYLMYPEASAVTTVLNKLPAPARALLGKPGATATSAAHNYGSQIHSTASSIVASDIPTAVPGRQTLQDLLSVPGGEQNALVVRHDPANTAVVAVDMHADKDALLAEHAEAKHWDDLPEAHKEEWKRKLVAAGYWAEHEGEKVLKGVMFSTYAGIVGQAAGEILREL